MTNRARRVPAPGVVEPRVWPFGRRRLVEFRGRWIRVYTPPAPANFRCWKHSLQNTGRPCVGRNGTVVSFPHAEHWVCVSTRSLTGAGPALTRLARLALHVLQRFGSFLNCLSAKNNCSPAVQMNSDPQSTHLKDLSWNSIGRHLVLVDRGTVRYYSVSRPELLAVTLSRQRLLGSALVTRLQVERVLLDVLDDVFLLNLALEAAESALDRLALLNLDFSHA